MDARELKDRLSLIVITDPDCRAQRTVLDVVRSAVRAGAPAIQLRDKHGDARDLLELAVRLRAETSRAGALFFVNDRVDVALVSGADGVHLGDDDLPVSAVRSIAPAGFLIGRSVDGPAEAAVAAAEGADYLGAGPVRATPSKTDAGPAMGVAGIEAVCRAVGLPVVAIGGIDASNARRIARAGAAGVAVIRAVMRAPDPEEVVAGLLAEVEAGRLSR
jgi:thiamine-phosphate pyrophosphorylase